MKKILFTKELNKNWLKKNLTSKLDFEIYSALKIEIYPQEKFIKKIDLNSSKFIISSQNAVKAIYGLEINGKFLAIGKNTARQLKEIGSDIVHCEDYAIDLANYIVDNYEPQTWNFFCGNNRRKTLFEQLSPNGHTLNEIICYDSIPMNLIIDSDLFDAFVFFSPLAVKTFFSNNSVPENSVIFSIGKTTTEEIKNYTKNTLITANVPLQERVIEKINTYYDTKK